MGTRAGCPSDRRLMVHFCPFYAAFPLIFVRHLQRNKDGPETVPEADSDFEEITAAENKTVCYLEYILNLLDTHQIYDSVQYSLIDEN